MCRRAARVSGAVSSPARRVWKLSPQAIRASDRAYVDVRPSYGCKRARGSRRRRPRGPLKEGLPLIAVRRCRRRLSKMPLRRCDYREARRGHESLSQDERRVVLMLVPRAHCTGRTTSPGACRSPKAFTSCGFAFSRSSTKIIIDDLKMIKAVRVLLCRYCSRYVVQLVKL